MRFCPNREAPFHVLFYIGRAYLVLLAMHAGSEAHLLKKHTAATLFAWAKLLSIGKRHVSPQVIPEEIRERQMSEVWDDENLRPSVHRNKKTKNAPIPAAAAHRAVLSSDDDADEDDGMPSRNFTWHAGAAELAVNASRPRAEDVDPAGWVAYPKQVHFFEALFLALTHASRSQRVMSHKCSHT